MLEGRLIVCLASRWDLDPTSKHHLMRHLGQHNDILWINYHATRRPQFNGRDLRAGLQLLRRVVGGPERIDDRMVQLTPLVLPGARTTWQRWLNRQLVLTQIGRAIRRVRRSRRQPVQLWTFAPDADFLAGQFDAERLVYYCVDEFSAFEGFDAATVQAAESRLLDAADVVITSAAALYEARRRRHPAVHLVRHGVDHAHFAQAVRWTGPRPAPLRDLTGPIAGFFGLVQHWFDVRLVATVASAMPDVQFVVIGDVQTDIGPLQALGNVHFTGRQPYASLPAYCAAFDVGLIPFVRSAMTENVNPIKLREYLAAGLPVVSTALPEVRRFAPPVHLADRADAFVAAVRTALTETGPAARARRSAQVADQSWAGVTEHVSRVVLSPQPSRDGPPATTDLVDVCPAAAGVGGPQ